MDLQSRIEQIFNDPRLFEEEGNEEALIAEYGSESAAEAIYLLAKEFDWQSLYDHLVDILLDNKSCARWETVQVILFYAASDTYSHKIHRYLMPTDFTIALLYHRFPDGIDDGDRIWSIVCNLKDKVHWSDYDPLTDEGVKEELKKLKCY